MRIACWELRVLDFQARVCGPARLIERLSAGRPTLPCWAIADARGGPQLDVLVDGRRVLRNGAVFATADRHSECLALVDRALTAAAVEHLGHRNVLLHAGAAARGQVGLLLPAASGSGKSTLVAGLLAAGWSYLSDEVAVFDPGLGYLTPFPNSLGIKAGGRRLFADTYPELASVPRRRIDGRAIWPLRPPDAAWPAAPVRVAAVVLPQFLPRARPRLTPIGRSTALAACVSQAHRLRDHGAAGLSALVAMVREAECYALTSGDLDASLDLLRAVLPG